MLIPTLPGWKVETIGDDIAWMKFGPDGRLYAINPETGFFGVAPGTSFDSNPNAMRTISKNTIFTNVALTEDGDVWWGGIGYNPTGKLIDWKGNEWVYGKSTEPAAHPNARFTTPASQCPSIASEWEDPNGVPISAIIFGGRRPSTIPLVYQATDWVHGVFVGSVMGSEVTTAALDLKAGTIRRDPFAMLPFCGYNMGDYFAHWLRIGKMTSSDKLPNIFNVNWFRKTPDGRWLWPGFGENSRVLAWIFERCDNEGKFVETQIGYMPTLDAIQPPQSVSIEDMKELLMFDQNGWLKELEFIEEHYKIFGNRLPPELKEELNLLEKRVKNGKEV